VALGPSNSVVRPCPKQVVISAPASHYVYPRLSCMFILPQLATTHAATLPRSHHRRA
jgi:hypothetical protein